MRSILTGISVMLLLAQSGLAEMVITAQDHAVESDVVLESALDAVITTPADTVAVVGDTLTFVVDETVTTAKGVKAIFAGASEHQKAQKAGKIETAEAWLESNDILFRSYTVSETVGEQIVGGAIGGAVMDAEAFFTGIEFSKGASAYYRPEFRRLFVRNTLSRLLEIEDVLAEYHGAENSPDFRQIEIETKFIEVGQNTLNELGFDWDFKEPWNLGGDDSSDPDWGVDLAGQTLDGALRTARRAFGAQVAGPAGTMMLSVESGMPFDLVVSALEQAEDTDVLSAPRLTTLDGDTAEIWVGEERMMPESFNVKAQSSSPYIEHDDWDVQDIGVHLEVTPTVQEDNMIDLELKPQVIDLIGYDDYQITPDNIAMLPWGGSGIEYNDTAGTFGGTGTAGFFGLSKVMNLPSLGITKFWNRLEANGTDPSTFYTGLARDPHAHGVLLPSLHGQLPYYRIREIETQLTVADGSTVGMGGLIYDKLETYKDKVPVLGSIPFLGRLFRSEGERSVKRNLVIFVTATQVDTVGRRASDIALNK